jgi:hypothetical protein
MKTPNKELVDKAYERGIQQHLKRIAESGSDLHENYTPAEICDMMLDKVDLKKAESILVLYNIELLFSLKKRRFSGRVTFFTQSQEKVQIASKILPNVEVEYIDKEENPIYHMENKWPEKFDIVIANPPYNKSLHLKFLEKSVFLSNEDIVFVQPASYIVETKGKYKPFLDAVNCIKPYVESIDLFNGNGVFNIGLYIPCAIVHLNKNTNSDIISVKNRIWKNSTKIKRDQLDRVTMFGVDERWDSFRKKAKDISSIKENSDLHSKSSWGKKKNLENENSYFVEFAKITAGNNRGNLSIDDKIHKNDFFIVISKYQLEVKNGVRPKFEIFFEFETEIEAQNFLSYLTTDFVRACLATTKFAQSLYAGELSNIPWMDFSQEWTDEKLYAHFNITKEEQAFIKEIIQPYYD